LGIRFDALPSPSATNLDGAEFDELEADESVAILEINTSWWL
jgi:hypothetical protein